MACLTDRVESRKCDCETSKSIDDPALLNLLPVEYKYALCELKKSDNSHFESKFRVNISSKVEALKWFEEFKYSSNTFFTKAKTFQEDTQGNVFKTVWKCIHNTRPAHTVKLPSKKHTNCPARLIITVKQTLLTKKYQSRDIHLKDLPMVVTLRHIHNHSTKYREPSKFETPDSDVEKIFLSYFTRGYTPSKAMDMFVKEMEKEISVYDNFTLFDLAICPDERWVYHFYYRVFLADNDKREEIKKEKYNVEKIGFGESYSLEEILDNMSETSEILLVDSVGNIERISLFQEDVDSGEDMEEEIKDPDLIKNKYEECNNSSEESEAQNDDNNPVDQLQLIFKNIIDKVIMLQSTKQGPSCLQAVEQFIGNTKKITSDRQLISAISQFGESTEQSKHVTNRIHMQPMKLLTDPQNTACREKLKRRRALEIRLLKNQ